MIIGICDDQSDARDHLKKYCCKLGCQDILMYPSGEELLHSPELTSLDLVFLDIYMEGINGIEVKERMERLSPATLIAFCSAHQERMIDTFGWNVLSFLSKPIEESSVKKCIEHAAYIKRDFYPIEINKDDILACGDVVYLQAEQKYTVFYTTDGMSHLTRKSLKNWARELNGLGFCQVSRSTVINLKYLKKTIYDDKKLLLACGVPISISRNFQELLLEQLDLYNLHDIRRVYHS